MNSRAVTASPKGLALAMLLGCLMLFVTASGAAAATGSISGKVTDGIAGSSEFGDAVLGIEATAYEAKTLKSAQTATTNAAGEYDVTGLAGGKYVVGFKPIFQRPLDFAPQFYKEKPRISEAEEVPVTEGVETKGINAKLLKGGSVSGTVTDAATHQPLNEYIVYGVSATDSEPISLAVTNSSGEYTLIGLPSGSLYVLFVAPVSEEEEGGPYSAQLYDDRTLPESLGGSLLELLPLLGNAVEVTAPNTTSGIDAALVRREPVDITAPVVSGTPAVGQGLPCSTGSWTGSGTLTYTYAWLRDGTAIAGATGSTYVVQTADQGNALVCVVTATNVLQVKKEPHSVSVSAVSNTLTVPGTPVMISPPPSPPPVVGLSSSKSVVSAGSAPVALTCANANCTGTIELTEQTIVKQRKGKRTTSKKETVVLGKGSYSLAAGHSGTIDIHLTTAGKSALTKAQHQRLSAKVHVSVTGGKTVEEAVALSEPPAAKHKPKHK
jgi:hypothetical protein